ncbi:hypothetical protein ACHQM5_019966 [Ranunculus cassubicifolius]
MKIFSRPYCRFFQAADGASGGKVTIISQSGVVHRIAVWYFPIQSHCTIGVIMMSFEVESQEIIGPETATEKLRELTKEYGACYVLLSRYTAPRQIHKGCCVGEAGVAYVQQRWHIGAAMFSTIVEVHTLFDAYFKNAGWSFIWYSWAAVYVQLQYI